MYAVLEETIRLASLIRNSIEAEVWREAWNELPNIWSGEKVTDISEEMPINEFVFWTRMADSAQTRPLLFPLFLDRFFYRPSVEFFSELSQYPLIDSLLKKLAKCSSLTLHIITFLRANGTGFPHQDLVYTISDVPWMKQTSYEELPWKLRESVTSATDARFLGLNRFISSASIQVADSLNNLALAIKQDTAWQSLDHSYKIIAKNKNLKNELQNSNNQFQKLIAETRAKMAPVPITAEIVQSIVSKVYQKKGDRINAYVESFLEFDKLIERIYWLLSQIIMHKTITFSSTSDQEMLQQVNVGLGKEQHITAISPTSACGGIGRIYHISLPESGGIFDGLYQVTNSHLTYQAGNRLRLFFNARLLWSCPLSIVTSFTGQTLPDVFIQSEKNNLSDGLRLTIGDGIASFGIKELTSFEHPRTIYS